MSYLRWGYRYLFLLLGLSVSCGPLEFSQARFFESSRRFSRAAKAYERFASAHPKDRRAIEALVRAGRIYAEVLGHCDQALPLYEQAARMENAEKDSELWALRARLGLLECPDYFPFHPGSSWVYVDTQSGGRNMRLEISVAPFSGQAPTVSTRPVGGGPPYGRDPSRVLAQGEMVGAYYAGSKRFREYRREYAKGNWAIWETVEKARLPILKYPFRRGQAWSAQSPAGTVEFRIEEEAAAVRTKAGNFSGCLKVRQQIVRYSSWIYDYYCPGVGRVKTTVGIPGAENPNTELASYGIPGPALSAGKK